jgi:hypothetical protein
MKTTNRRVSVRGAMSAVILLALVPLVIALGALLTLAVGHHEDVEQDFAGATARATSFSGAQDALARLEISRTLSGQYDLPMNGGVARVTATPWKGDGIDNDDNGLIDEAAESQIFELRSEGWLNALPTGVESSTDVQSFHGATDAIVEVVDFMFAFDQAIYIDDPKANIDFNGSAFELTGKDEDLDGSSGPENARPAIGINGDPSFVKAQIAGNQKACITGNLPNPAIGTTGALKYDDFVAKLAPLSVMDWTTPSATYSGAIGDLAQRKGIVAHATGNLKLHGSTTGAGILLVDGDLELDGKFTFAGLIIVKGNVMFDGGGGKKELYGAMLLWGKDPTPQPVEDLQINGSVQIAYSSEGLDIASATGPVNVLFWKEL